MLGRGGSRKQHNFLFSFELRVFCDFYRTKNVESRSKIDINRPIVVVVAAFAGSRGSKGVAAKIHYLNVN